MYNNILVAIDASQESVNIIRKGKALAEANSASLKVVHFVEQPYINYAYGELVAQQYLPSTEEVKAQVMPALSAQMEAAGVAVSQLHIEIGIPSEAVCELALEESADLIVVGSHGRHGLRLLLGSTANSILHHARCDVLAVRVFDED